jgi:uncharacterized membrane protein YhaH (DUF805 family)
MKEIKTLFSFQGRISRSIFWAVSIGSFIFLVALGGVMRDTEIDGKSPYETVLILTYMPIAIWVNAATQVKRWHDRDRSGWMFLFNMVPFVGWIYCMIVLGLLKGTSGANRYGPDPLAVANSSPS